MLNLFQHLIIKIAIYHTCILQAGMSCEMPKQVRHDGRYKSNNYEQSPTNSFP